VLGTHDLTPGPDTLYIVGRSSIILGCRAGAEAALGIGTRALV
jgi:threonine/homoserine/homoserine lactone efflux protein